jgi:hypothetical protein
MADPYKNNVVLYLPMEGSRHGDTVILDRTGKTVTRNGDVVLSTAVAPPFGTTSAYFDGSGDYLLLGGQSDFAFGTADFTLEFWVRHSVASAYEAWYDSRPISTQGNYVAFYRHVDNSVRLYVNSADRIISGSTLSINTWYHLALVRYLGVSKIFINGVAQSQSYTDTTNYLNAASRPVIGAVGDNLATLNFSGYLKDLRITKGIARYTGNFHVAQKPYDWDEPEQPRIML